MDRWAAHLRAEVTYDVEFESASPSGDVATEAGDRLRALLPELPEGLRWSVFSIDVRRLS